MTFSYRLHARVDPAKGSIASIYGLICPSTIQSKASHVLRRRARSNVRPAARNTRLCASKPNRYPQTSNWSAVNAAGRSMAAMGDSFSNTSWSIAVTRGQQSARTALYPTTRFCPRLAPRSCEALFVFGLFRRCGWRMLPFSGNERKPASSPRVFFKLFALPYWSPCQRVGIVLAAGATSGTVRARQSACSA